MHKYIKNNLTNLLVKMCSSIHSKQITQNNLSQIRLAIRRHRFDVKYKKHNKLQKGGYTSIL